MSNGQKKKFIIFILALLSFSPLVFHPKQIFADDANCKFTFSENPLNQNMGTLTVSVTTPDLHDQKVRIYMKTPRVNITQEDHDLDFKTNGGVSADFKPFSTTSIGWVSGDYTFYLAPDVVNDITQNYSCHIDITMNDLPEQKDCKVEMATAGNIDTTTPVDVAVHQISNAKYDICWTYNDKNMPAKSQTINGDGTVSFGLLDKGAYTIKIRKDGSGCTAGQKYQQIQCNLLSFTVSTPGGSAQPAPIATPVIDCKKDPASCTIAAGETCTKPGDPADPKGPGFKTAFGCIHTNPGPLIQDLFKFLLGISGGIAFFMMIYGAIKMITSQGNPQALAGSKELFTNAVVGLLFIIFAVLLLQIIGVDILQLPDLSK